MKKRNVLIGEREELPNVTGSFYQWKTNRATGVFTSSRSGYCNSYNGGNDDRWITTMDLSKGSTIYKDNGHVIPNSIITRIWKRIN